MVQLDSFLRKNPVAKERMTSFDCHKGIRRIVMTRLTSYVVKEFVFLAVYFLHVADEVENLVGIADFVVIP